MKQEDSKILTYVHAEVNRRLHLLDPESVPAAVESGDVISEVFDLAIENSAEILPDDWKWFEKSSRRRFEARRNNAPSIRRSTLRKWGRALLYFEELTASAEALNHMLLDSVGEWIKEPGRENEALLGIGDNLGGKPLKMMLLLSIHSRACALASEVGFLATGGFPEGMRARTRTLHETTVTAAALCLGDGDSTEVSDRYAAWTVSEDRKKRLLGNEHGWASSTEPDPDDAELEAAAEAAWGHDFFKANGWAAPLFPGRRPPIPFNELEDLVQMSDMRWWYLQGNEAIHAGPSAMMGRADFRTRYLNPTGPVMQHNTVRNYLALAARQLFRCSVICCHNISGLSEDWDGMFAIQFITDRMERTIEELKSGGMHLP